MKHILLIILGCVILTFPALAQKESLQKKDSLRRVVAISKGEEKLKVHLRLASIYFAESRDRLKMDTLLSLYKEIDKEAEAQGNLKYQGIIRTNILIAYYNNRRYDDLLQHIPEYLDFLSEKKAWKYYNQCYLRLLETYLAKGEFNKAIEGSRYLYTQAEERKDEEGMAVALYSMAEVYSEQRRYKEEEDCLRQCIAIMDNNDTMLHLLAKSWFDLCQLLLGQKRYDEVLKSASEFEKVNVRYDASAGITVPTSWGNLWGVYVRLYTNTGEYDKALEYCDKINNIIDSPPYKVIVYYAQAKIFNLRGKYAEALEAVDKALYFGSTNNAETNSTRELKSIIFSNMGRWQEAYGLFKKVASVNDSIRNIELAEQIDIVRTQYEVDKITSEKEEARNYMYFALVGCVLLALLLGIRIYYSRQVAKKNRALANQIKELKVQQEHLEEELLNKMTFDIEEDSGDDFCPAKRKDLLCITIRDAILKEKAYRDPLITRDNLIERIGTNKELFIDAFQYCFGMSFSEYINYLRLKDAVTLLEQSDLSIEDVSDKVGFGTIRTFQRQFQIKYNMSPKDYRKATMK